MFPKRAMSPFLYLPLLALVVTQLPAADWPSWRGPNGDGTATDSGKQLIRNPKQAKQVWTSELEIPGAWSGNGMTSTKQHCSGYNSPILYDGRIYHYYSLPDGGDINRVVIDKNLEPIKQRKSQQHLEP